MALPEHGAPGKAQELRGSGRSACEAMRADTDDRHRPFPERREPFRTCGTIQTDTKRYK